MSEDNEPSAYDMMVSVQADIDAALEKARIAYMQAAHPSRIPALKLIGLVEDVQRKLLKELPETKPPIVPTAPNHALDATHAQREVMQAAKKLDPGFSAFPSATRS